ncbi:MAG: hypothetical protein PUB99_06305 [Oscillospiraceae bacterium]|nr:hypothetical protein [Oscillospiraceae bacterium]
MRTSLLLKIAAVLMVVVTIFTLASCSLFDEPAEEETTTERPAVALEARPETTAQVVAYFNKVVNNIKASRPGVSSSRSYDVKNVDTGDTAEAKALIQFAKSFSEALEKVKDSKEYGENLNDFLPLKGTDTVSRLTEADVVSAELTDVEDDQYVYDVHIVLQNSAERNGSVSNAFDFNIEKSEVLDTFTDYKDSVEVGDYNVSYDECEIFARVNKETNQVLSLNYVMNASVTASVSFCGSLADLGETDVSFTLREERSFNDFVWEEPTEAETAAE